MIRLGLALLLLCSCTPAAENPFASVPSTCEDDADLQYWVGYDVRELPSGFFYQLLDTNILVETDTNIFVDRDAPVPNPLLPGKNYFFLNGNIGDDDQTIVAIKCG